MNELELKNEGIRGWHKRTTRKAVRSIWISTAILALIGIFFYVFAPLSTLMRMQTFNGALTIPLAGALWIAAFMFVWLIPMREISFRSQESLDRSEERIVDAIEKKFNPAVETWKRIGDRIEGGLLDDVRDAVLEVRTIARRVDEAVSSAEARAKQLEEKYGPTAEQLKIVAAHIEEAFQGGVLKEMREAAQTLKQLDGMKAPRPEAAPALDIIRRRRPQVPATPTGHGSNSEGRSS